MSAESDAAEDEPPIEEVADEIANDPEISDTVRAIARTLRDGFREGRYS